MNPEKQTTHYRGRIITVTTDEVILPNGNRALLDIVRHPGGAVAVAVDKEKRVCLIRQYRYAADGYIWELPAGKLEPQEPPLETAQRELIEEAGVRAHQWKSLGVCIPSPGVLAEVLYLYFATDLEPAQTAHEHNEVIEVHWVPYEKAYRMVLEGQINDSKTCIGLMRGLQHL